MNNKLILGSALSLAALAVAIDHTQHRLPEPDESMIIVEEDGDDASIESPCGLSGSPCGL